MIITPITAEFVSDVAELVETERGIAPHRLPAWVRRQFPDPQLLAMEGQPSGVRVRFTTQSREVALVSHAHRVMYRGADRPRGRVDVVVDGAFILSDPLSGGDATEVDLMTGQAVPRSGEPHVTQFALPEGTHEVEIWLPHNEGLELLELRSDAALSPTTSRKPRWVHHGSSISHGSNALTPTEIWPAVAARQAGLELKNLGLGGSSLVDPFMARVIRDTEADLISVKFGINVVNLDGMRLRTFVPAVHGFLDTIRDGHPQTPIVLMSPIFCGIHENTPGPGAFDPSSIGSEQVRFVATGTEGDTAHGRLTLRVIRDALGDIAAQRQRDDTHLHFVDGLDLYSEADAKRFPLPDNLHPTAEAHALMGHRFADRLLAGAHPLVAS